MRSPHWALFWRGLSCLFAVLVLCACGFRSVADRLFRREIAGYQSAVDGTHPAVPALPGWEGGSFWPFVDLYSGNLLIEYDLLVADALGPDWVVALYYNSTLSGSSGVLGPGWRHSYQIALRPGLPGPSNITVEWGDGRADVFTDDGVGGWTADPSLQGRRITPIGGGYRLRTKHGLLYEFDGPGRMTSIRDRNNNAMVFAYDGFGRLSTVTDPSGRSCTYSYDGFGRLTQISGLPVQPVGFSYDGSNRLIQVTGAYPAQYVYDGLDRLIRVIDSNGNPMNYDYSPGLDVVQRVSMGSSTRTFFYDQGTLTTTVLDRLDASSNARTDYQFDGLGRVVAVDDGVLGQTSNLYGPLNLIEQHTDAAGRITQYQYDALGNLVRHEDPTAAATLMSYDPTYSLLTSLTDPLGKIWQWIRDPNGNVTRFRDPLLNETQYAYDGLGRRIQRIDPVLNSTSYGYDANSNLASVTDPALFTVSFARNVRGRVVSVTDQETNVWTFSLNGRDEVASVDRPPGPPVLDYVLTYTPAGFLQSIRDPLGAIWTYGYDMKNRLVSTAYPGGGTFQRIRNDAEHVIQHVDPLGRIESLGRDAVGRLLSRTGPDGDIYTYGYDCCDLTTTTDAMTNTATLSYTNDHKLAQVAWTGITNTYVYDAMDRLIHADRSSPPDPVISYDYAYDDAGRCVTAIAGHVTRTATVVYDAAGRPTQVSDNIQPSPVGFTYDSRGNVINVSTVAIPPAASATYTARGQLDQVTYPGGVTSDYTYDALGRLVRIENQSPAPFSGTYDLVYNSRDDRTDVLAITPATGPRDLHVVVDPKGRPTSEQYVPGVTTTYTYDGADNRTQRNAALYSYSLGHRLLSDGAGISQTWNANGRVTQLVEPGGTTNYVYGADGQMKSIQRGPQIWRVTRGPLGETARLVLPSGLELWPVEDRGGSRLLRRDFLPAPAVTPAWESIYGVMREHGPTPTPVVEFWGAQAPATYRAEMSGPDGTPTQVANHSGNLVADRYFGLFGDLQHQIGGQQPVQGFAGMDDVQGLDGLHFVSSVGPPVLGRVEGTPYLYPTGSFHDGGTFGADFYVQPVFTFSRAASWSPSPMVLDHERIVTTSAAVVGVEPPPPPPFPAFNPNAPLFPPEPRTMIRLSVCGGIIEIDPLDSLIDDFVNGSGGGGGRSDYNSDPVGATDLSLLLRDFLLGTPK